jgi:hypothetical protein
MVVEEFMSNIEAQMKHLIQAKLFQREIHHVVPVQCSCLDVGSERNFKFVI